MKKTLRIPYSIFTVLSQYMLSLPDKGESIKRLIEVLKQRQFEESEEGKVFVITFEKPEDGLPQLLVNLSVQLANELNDLAKKARAI